jgi:hypothetical protein
LQDFRVPSDFFGMAVFGTLIPVGLAAGGGGDNERLVPLVVNV